MASHRKARNARGLKMRKTRLPLPHAAEINKRFAGKHVAIIDGKVVASGKSPIGVWKRAKKLHPQRKPVLAFILKDAILVLSEEAGNARKSYYGIARGIGPFKVENEMKSHDQIRDRKARNVTTREVREASEGRIRVRSAPSKLSDIAGSKTISKEDWQRAQRVLRSARALTTSLK